VLMALRHLASFLALPFVMAVVIPLSVVRRVVVPELSPLWIAGTSLVFLIGLTLFATSLYEFATRGRGTLAPWDPPRELVVRGPYRYVRNPMITGVVCVILAEAMLLQSRSLATWALTFVLINAIYIPLLEEPQLAQRFGDAYREYCRNVPRLIPRLSAWMRAGE
jgi:protein-S-isoprenylcysteine O-methyltransferase Ste14